jgi:2-dehydro-3-deoxygluconokinase
MRLSDRSILSIGECMVELSRGTDNRFGLAYGGDTFNTAVYLARAGGKVSYLTALGDDPYSDAIVALALKEGIATDLIPRIPGRMPGLYMIETTATGERSFYYWRDRAPAREIFDHAASAPVTAAMKTAGLIYISGISLSLYAPPALEHLASALSAARASGAKIAMDGNYRPRGWAGDKSRAQSVMARFWQMSDIALPTFDDEQALWGDATPAITIRRLAALGVPEIVVKNGSDGARIASSGKDEHIPCPEIITPIDTTAAGDSFNAGYLARRRAGDKPSAAAAFAHRLAGIVIQHRGAIVPQSATAALFATLPRP